MRVVIAEDQVLLREGLGRLFEDGGHEVVASLGDAERVLSAVDGHRPDLVALGGFGYLLKDRVLQVEEFLAAAERVAKGGSALDPKLVARLVSPEVDDDQLAELSDREREVLELIAEGLTNAGIAKRLYLSERTVEAHVRHLLMKLDLPADGDGNPRVLAVLAYLRAPAHRQAQAADFGRRAKAVRCAHSSDRD